MDEKACKVETDLLLKCWKVHGAEEVDETHPCNSAQDQYMRCVRINVCPLSVAQSAVQLFFLEISL